MSPGTGTGRGQQPLQKPSLFLQVTGRVGDGGAPPPPASSRLACLPSLATRNFSTQSPSCRGTPHRNPGLGCTGARSVRKPGWLRAAPRQSRGPCSRCRASWPWMRRRPDPEPGRRGVGVRTAGGRPQSPQMAQVSPVLRGDDAHFPSQAPTSLHLVLPGEQRQSSRARLSSATSPFPDTRRGGPVVPFPGRHPQEVSSRVGNAGVLPRALHTQRSPPGADTQPALPLRQTGGVSRVQRAALSPSHVFTE